MSEPITKAGQSLARWSQDIREGVLNVESEMRAIVVREIRDWLEPVRGDMPSNFDEFLDDVVLR